jgi:hypothetical protein
MEQIFQEIGKALKGKKFSTFKIVGYQHVDFLIKLIYHDCDEYYRAVYDGSKNDGSFLPLQRIGWSTNRKEKFEADNEYKALEQEIKNTFEKI